MHSGQHFLWCTPQYQNAIESRYVGPVPVTGGCGDCWSSAHSDPGSIPHPDTDCDRGQDTYTYPVSHALSIFNCHSLRRDGRAGCDGNLS